MSTVVTNIQITSHDTVSFYEGSDVVMNVSQVVDGTSLCILRSGLNIIILNKSTGNPIPLDDGGTSNDHFVFSTIPIITIGSRTYTKVDQASSTSGEENLQRAKDIYTYLVNNIFKGCCDCSSDDTCSIQYKWDTLSDGAWTFSSGVLIMSLTSYNEIDFSGLFHHFPDGSWISFFQSGDPANYSIFEISNYSVVSGYAVWDAVLVDGQSSYVGNPIFCTTYQPALASGGGGSQGWQQTLDVDPDLDKDNTVDGGAFDFNFNNFTDFQVNVINMFRALASAGGYFSRVYIDPTTGSFDVSGTGTQSGKIAVSNSGGAPIVTLRATDGASDTVEIILEEAAMFIVTPDVNAGTAVNGQYLKLTDHTNGESEFDYVKYWVPYQIDTNGDQVNASATSYYNVFPGSAADSTEATRQDIISVSGTARRYAIQTATAQPASGSCVITLRKSGVSTALTITIAAGSAAGIFTDNVNTASVASQSDLMSHQVVNNATAASCQFKVITFVVEVNA